MSFTENKGAENALATLGAVLWSVQIVPQIVKSYREKSTLGLSGGLMLWVTYHLSYRRWDRLIAYFRVWAIASVFLGTYLVVQRLSIPLQLQPQLFGLLSAISWTQTLYYGRGYSVRKAGAYLAAFCVLFAGFEAGSVFALWTGQDRGIEWPILMYGYIGAALLALALGPQYFEIYRLKKVIGISLFFLSVDILGGVFSFSSLFFRDTLDIAAFVSYALVVVLDSIVIILAWILNPMARRREAKEAASQSLPSPATQERDSASPTIGMPARVTSNTQTADAEAEKTPRVPAEPASG